MAAAKAAMEQLGLDRLILIPDRDPPHKDLAKDAATPEQRLEMTRLMADGLGPRAEASDLELRRTGKSYTADTVEELHAQFPEDELWLLMGTDMFLTVQNWYQPERIFQYAGVAAFSRSHEDTAALFQAQCEYLADRFHARTTVVDLPEIKEIASRDLRRMLEAEWSGGKGDPGEYLWPPVYGYILREGLFGTKADLKHLSDKHLRAVSYSMVKAKRIPHIKGTEETAVALAKYWGVDQEKARRAAILHDCTKYWELEPQVATCDKYGIHLDELERVSVKFLHSKTGAAMAKYVFGEPDDVYDAIFCHTTGKPGMTTFDKILYLADYMEPTRDFDGVEELRRLVYEDLDQAMILGLEMTVEELHERGAIVHQNTQGTLDELRGRRP
jgi:nicotinate-nucleotide adenylyltransferase